MDQRNKIAVALGVMFAGVAAALWFRIESPRSGPVPPGALDRLVLQSGADDPAAVGNPVARALAPGGTAGRAAPFPPPLLDPPDMAQTFPAHRNSPLAAAAPAAGGAAGAAPVEKPLRHKIVDGDTLAALAERYLGSPRRAMEIYQNNRELLPSPDLLPIGVEITIPKRKEGLDIRD